MSNLQLPDGWEIKTLGEVAQVVSGGTPARDNPEFWREGTIPWATPTDITNSGSRVLTSTADRITLKGLNSCTARLLPLGSLLMTSRATLGEIKVAGTEVCTNQGFKSLVPNESADTWYLYYQMQLSKETYSVLGIGSTFLEVNKRDTESFPILLPPLPEQHKIAKVLTTVDNLIEKTKALIAKYQAIKQGMMHDLFTRGVDEHGRLRPPYEEAPELYKESELGWIPREWNMHRMEDLTLKIVDGVHHTPKYIEQGIPFVTVKNLTSGDSIDLSDVNYISLQDHEEFFKRSDPRAGDVLVTKDGTLGVARIVLSPTPDFSIFVSVAQLRPNPENCLPQLLWLFFDSRAFEGQLGRLSAGTGLRHIHLEHFREFRVATPPLREQEEIFRRLDTHQSRLKSEQSSLRKLRNIKIGLMQDLLTGKARVKVDETEETSA
jgi:type I restriction enzyme S subunit